MTDQYIAATALAKRWDLKTGTLSKWRRLGKGPQGWKYQSKTRVIYSMSEVESFETRMSAEKPAFIPPLSKRCRRPAVKRHSFTQDGAPRVGCSSCGETIEPTMTTQEVAAR